MPFLNLLTDYSAQTIIALMVLAFIAGLIDAVVGGGGLIQMPALLINLPNTLLATLLGTSKIAALSGTSVAAYQYSKRIKFDFKLLSIISLFASIASFLGAKVVSFINTNTLKQLRNDHNSSRPFTYVVHATRAAVEMNQQVRAPL